MSVVSLLFLNIDKFISLYYPLHYHQIVTEKFVALQLLISWTGTVMYTVFSYTGPFVDFIETNETECLLSVDPEYYLVMIIAGYIFPLLISLAISIYIFIIAQRMTAGSRAIGRGSINLGGNQTSRRDRKTMKNRLIRRIMFVFSSTLWTSVTSLPYR